MSGAPNTSSGLLQGIAGRMWGRDTGSGARLTSGTFWTLVMKVVFSGLSFVVGLLLARWLGSTGYGAYTYAAAWAMLISGPATAGLDNIVLRDMAACESRGAWSEMRGLLTASTRVVALLSCALTAAAIAAAWLFQGRTDRTVLITLMVALLLIPLLALTRIWQSALQGLHFVGESQFAGFVVQPVFFVAALAGLRIFVSGRLNAPAAMGINVAAMTVAAVVLLAMLWRRIADHIRKAGAAPYRISWTGSVIPLVIFGAVNVLYNQTDLVFLGAMKGARTVGIYGAASRSAGLITFFLQAVTPALMPVVSSLYAKRDLRQLERVAVRGARLTLAGSLIVAMFFFVAGRWYLTRFFGADFGGGYTALAILTAGRLVNTALGSVAYLLVMTGFEREAAIGAVAGAIVNAALNGALIPVWGMNGAALAFAGSLIFSSVWYAVVAYRRIGIHSTAFGRMFG